MFFARLIICFSVLFTSFSYAATDIVYTGRMNKAITSILEYKFKKLNTFYNLPLNTARALNAQRILAVNTALQTAATRAVSLRVAAGLAASAGVASVSWPVIVAGAGVVAGGSYLYATDCLSVDCIAQLVFSLGQPSDPFYGVGLINSVVSLDPNAYSLWPSNWASVWAVTPPAAIAPDYEEVWFRANSAGTSMYFTRQTYVSCPSSGPIFCYDTVSPSLVLKARINAGWTAAVDADSSVGQWSRFCSSLGGGQYRCGYTWIKPGGGAYSLPTSVSVPATTPTEATEYFPVGERAKPLSDAQLANVVNALLNLAAVGTPEAFPEEYGGTPYVPIQDIRGWRTQYTGTSPTVDDYRGPIAPPYVEAPSIPEIGTTTDSATAPVTDAGTGTGSAAIEWGAMDAPALDTPSVSSFLDPIFNLWDSWSGFQLPAHSSVCPQGSFTLPASIMNGQTFTMDVHCDFIENFRSQLEAMFLVFWIGISIFIVMRT